MDKKKKKKTEIDSCYEALCIAVLLCLLFVLFACTHPSPMLLCRGLTEHPTLEINICKVCFYKKNAVALCACVAEVRDQHLCNLAGNWRRACGVRWRKS